MNRPTNTLPANRSVPACTVIPVLAYEDVGQAVDWLCAVFGFTERLRIGSHRAQLLVGDGAVIVSKWQTDQSAHASEAALSLSPSQKVSHSLLVRVEDVDRHHKRAQECGARILHPPADYPYGERQYTVEDPGGHLWVFSQSIADVEPSTWGATVTNKEAI